MNLLGLTQMPSLNPVQFSRIFSFWLKLYSEAAQSDAAHSPNASKARGTSLRVIGALFFQSTRKMKPAAITPFDMQQEYSMNCSPLINCCLSASETTGELMHSWAAVLRALRVLIISMFNIICFLELQMNKASHSFNLLLTLLLIISLVPARCSITSDLLSELSNVNQKIYSLQSNGVPEYQFVKIIHSIVQGAHEEVVGISSSNVYDSDGTAYPMVLKLGLGLYSLRGQKLLSLETDGSVESIFTSSSRNEPLYVASVQKNNAIIIKKLSFSTKTPAFELKLNFTLTSAYGAIKDYSNCFSLSKELYAFTTDMGYLILVKKDGSVESAIKIPLKGLPPYQIRILKLNTKLLIYTSDELFILSTNGKAESLIACQLPSGLADVEVKFDDNNWKNFFVRSGSLVYTFSYDDLSCRPQRRYQLLSNTDQFDVASSMLLGHSRGIEMSYYYNLTTGDIKLFNLPPGPCRKSNYTRNSVSVRPKSMGAHILCDICSDWERETTEYSCYILQAVSESMENRMDKGDYSKFRIPIVFFSLCIVIYLSINRKNKHTEDLEKDEQLGLLAKSKGGSGVMK